MANAVRTWSKRILLGLLGLAALALFLVWAYLRASLAQLDGSVTAAGLHAEVTVVRDAQGVPTISGSNRDDVAYAAGYVHGQERFFQMDLLRRSGAGELAELFGARALPSDRSNRFHRFRARADAAVAAMGPAERRLLERYVAGVNDGLGALVAHPFEYKLIGLPPRRWTMADSLLVVWAMFFDLQGNLEPRELARGWFKEHSDPAQLAFLLPEASEWDAPLDAAGPGVTAVPVPPQAPAWWGRRYASDAPKVAAADFMEGIGSNDWVVSGKRSADGGAIVSDDMHLSIRLPNIWYRQVLQFPDAKGVKRRVVGVSLPGAGSLIVVGSNGQVAWGFTNSYGDFLDLVALDSDAEHPGQLGTPSGWETPETVTETILVKGREAVQFPVRSVSLGPVREAGGRSYAVHWTAHAPGAVSFKSIDAETVANVDEALAAAAKFGIPGQNFVAGDARGNIGWTIAGHMPRRARPGLAATFPLDAASADAGWDTLLAPQDHPKIVNPASGQLVTANNRQLMGQGAQLIGDGGFDIGARARQARDGVAALGNKTSVKDVYGVMMDDRALFMAPWRERAIKALDPAALAGQPLRAEFLRLLKDSWTGRASVDSQGYLLTRNFMWALHEMLYGGANSELSRLNQKSNAASASSRWPAVVARLIDGQEKGWLPPDYQTWQQVQLVAIDQVITNAIREYGSLSAATWGRRNTVVIEHPIAAAAPALRAFLSAPADMMAGDSHMPRVSSKGQGQSERMTVTPGKEELGIFNMPGGQSGHPMSPFFLSGHADWVAGKPTPLLPGAPRHTLQFVSP